MIEAGMFRQDLYYRISAFPITMPPLRARREDLPLLCEMALATIASTMRMSREALAALATYDFPGNIRELRNLMERAVLLADGDVLQPKHFPAVLHTPTPQRAPVAASCDEGGPWPWGDEIISLDALQTRYLEWAKTRIPDDRGALAQRLGISERTLYRKLSRTD